MRRLSTTLACGFALVAAGCGGGGGGSTSTAAATSGPVVKVQMRNIQFNPKTLVVKKGTTVEWVNDDSVGHDVTKDTGPGPSFSSGSGNIQNGSSYKQTFDQPGTIRYECTVHPGMTGTIVVR